MQAIGYVRVSTDEQGNSGAGLASQRAAIQRECEHRGWQLREIVQDVGYSAKNLRRDCQHRPSPYVIGSYATPY